MGKMSALLTSTESDSEILTPINITDEQLRKRLLDAALSMEQLLKDGIWTLDTVSSPVNKIGLKVTTSMEQKHEDKPIVFLFEYSLNIDKWKEWVDDHAYLLEHNLGFTSRGIQFTISGGSPNAYKNVLTSIRIKDENTVDDIMPFDLLTGTIVFAVHKNVFNEHEWTIMRIG